MRIVRTASGGVIAALLALALLVSLDAACFSAFADDAETCVKAAGDEGIAACTRVITAGKGNLAWAYTNRGNDYNNKGDYDRAIADYDRAVRLDPKYAPAFNGRGSAYKASGDNDRAIADYDAAIRLDPKQPIAYFNRGVTYQAKGDNDRAIADYDAVIRLNPQYAMAYSNRGNAYQAKGDNDHAIADYDKAIRLDPRQLFAHNNRGNAYKAKGDNDRAIANYDEAIRLDPKYAAAYNNRGNSYMAKGDDDRAMADYDQAIKLDPKESVAWNSRCWLRATIGQLEAALADCNESLRLKPGVSSTLDSRGFTYLRLKQLAKAIEDFDAALRIDPKKAHSLYPRGLAKQLSNIAGGDLDIKAAISIKPDIAEEFARYGYAASPVAGLPPPSPDVAPAVGADPGRRVALVIGNGGYTAVSALPNPRADAAAVAAALRGVGFQVVRLEQDLPRDKLIDALRSFAREADTADWALVYFAGHGIEANGTNYLVPVDARLEVDRDIEYEAVPLNQVLGAVEGARKLRIVLLDACRDNPFARQMRRTVATRSIGRGLARVEPEGGTLVAYAAKDGQIALDGDGANSPFVAALVKRLPTPGVELGKLFRLVRDDVLKATGRKQEPFVYGSLPGDDFFFVAAKQ